MPTLYKTLVLSKSIQGGMDTIMGSTKTVTFPEVFKATPRVLVQARGNPGKFWWVSSISTTSFTLTANGNVNFDFDSIGVQV